MFNIKRITMRSVLYIVLIIHTATIAFPLYLMIISSFKDNKNIFSNPYKFSFENIFVNYREIFTGSKFYLYFANSLVVTLSSIILILILSSLAAFILAKYRFPLNKFIYLYFLIGIMIPIRLGTINIAQIFKELNLLNNLLALIIIYTAYGIPFGIFILTDFIRMIPEELSNAARIDGCSDYGIFLRIIIPLLKPALSTVAIITLLPIWNDFWFPLILIKAENLKTIPLAASSLFGQYETKWGLVFAVLTIASVPLIIIYLILSKQFMKGLSEGAFKGD